MASTASAKVNNNSKTVITDAQSMTPQEEKRMNRVYTRVFLMLLLDLIAFTVILPLLPGLLQHYGENDSVSILPLWCVDLTEVDCSVIEKKVEKVISLYCALI